MFCPNCGTSIHDQASFCAKCRKNVTYITMPPADGAEAPAKRSGPQADGFYCNHCGNFVLPEDNYCFECGKKTHKAFYTKTLPQPGSSAPAPDEAADNPESSPKKYTLLGIMLIIIVLATIVGYYMSTQLN